MSSVSHLSYPDPFARLKLLTLSHRRARDDMIEVFKITSNIYDPKVTTFFTYRDHTVILGSQIKKIYYHFSRICILHNFLSIHISKIWYSLPHGVVEASGLNIFKYRLDRHTCKRASHFHYDSDAFEQLSSDIQGSGHTGKYLVFRPVFIICIIGMSLKTA